MIRPRQAAVCLGLAQAALSFSAAAQQPAALVEYAAGLKDAKIQEMQFVYPGQRIELGEEGQITLTYFASCREETVDGGSLIVQPAGSDLQGAARVDSRVISCLRLTHRLTVPSGEPVLGRWKEWVIKTYEPLFLLPETLPSGAVLRLVLLEGDTPGEVWQTPANSSLLRYASRAVLLEGGVPYLAEILDDSGKPIANAVFSVDHDLDVTANASNSLVPLQPISAKPHTGKAP